MSVTSGFFNSINGDRTYNAEQMSSIFDGIINDGVFANIGTAFSVQATGSNAVNVGTGRCWFNSTWLLNDATLPIELDDAEVLLDRIDAIVIEINHSESVRAGSIKVVNGTPSSTPANPTMTHTDYINQYPIAYIMRSANSDAITQANIMYAVGSDACPFVTGILSVVSIQNIVAQWENEFDTWLDSLSAMLDDNTAANLANQILELKEQFDTLAKEKKIYSELEDSTGEDTIDDSTGSPILGTTAMYSDDGASESIPGTTTGGDPYKVGDTLTTARTDLGAKWLLCNGDALDRDLYPELANLFPYTTDITGTWNSVDVVTASSGNVFIEDMKYLNGQYVIVGANGGQSFLAYSANLEGPWTVKQPFSGTYTRLFGIEYHDGVYAVLAYNSSGYAVLYSNNLEGPWSTTTITTFTNTYGDYGYICVDGTYSVLCYDNEGSVGTTNIKFLLSYCSSLASGSWSSTNPINFVYSDDFTVGFPYPTAVSNYKFVNGFYIILGSCCEDSPNNDTSRTLPYMAYSTSLNGPWTKLWDTANSYYKNDVIHDGGSYIACGSSKGAGCLFVSSSLNGTWTKKTVFEDGELYTIMKVGEKYVVFGACTISSTQYYSIAESTSLDGPWVRKDIVEFPDYNTSFYLESQQNVYGDGSYAVGFRQRSPSPQKITVHYTEPGEINLPSISLSDKTYTYIRAKE